MKICNHSLNRKEIIKDCTSYSTTKNAVLCCKKCGNISNKSMYLLMISNIETCLIS